MRTNIFSFNRITPAATPAPAASIARCRPNWIIRKFSAAMKQLHTSLVNLEGSIHG